MRKNEKYPIEEALAEGSRKILIQVALIFHQFVLVIKDIRGFFRERKKDMSWYFELIAFTSLIISIVLRAKGY